MREKSRRYSLSVVAAEVRVAVLGKSGVDRRPVFGQEMALCRRQDDRFLAAQVVPQEAGVAGDLVLERARRAQTALGIGRGQGVDLLRQRRDKLVVALVLAVELVEHGVAVRRALAQAPEQVLLFLGVVQLDRELLQVVHDGAHLRRIDGPARFARVGQSVHPGMHHRGQ